MSRELKFRMWGLPADADMEEPYRFEDSNYDDEGNPLPVMIPAEHLAFEEYAPICELLKDSDTQKFMQYTGLKDAQGNEIYESDIVATDLPGPEYKEIVYGVVFWQDSEARFAVEWKCINGEPVKAGRWPAVSLAPQAKSVYVFGNIYENPNLLPKEDAP